MSLFSRNKKKQVQLQKQIEPANIEIKPIDASVLIHKLTMLNLQAKETVNKINQYRNAVEKLNAQLLGFGGAIEQIETMLTESGLNIETVYEQINADFAKPKT